MIQSSCIISLLRTVIIISSFFFPLPYFWQSFCLLQLHRASANIIEPTGESDNPLRFTSGLVVALDIDATLEHVQDPQGTVKVQVSSRLMQMPRRLCLTGGLLKDANTSKLQIIVCFINSVSDFWIWKHQTSASCTNLVVIVWFFFAFFFPIGVVSRWTSAVNPSQTRWLSKSWSWKAQADNSGLPLAHSMDR